MRLRFKYKGLEWTYIETVDGWRVYGNGSRRVRCKGMVIEEITE